MSVNSRLKATKVIGQMKAFYKQRIPDSSCVRKETVDIGILVTSRNGGTKIMQSIRISTSLEKKDLLWEKGSATSLASSEEHLPK